MGGVIVKEGLTGSGRVCGSILKVVSLSIKLFK